MSLTIRNTIVVPSHFPKGKAIVSGGSQDARKGLHGELFKVNLPQCQVSVQRLPRYEYPTITLIMHDQ